MEVGRNVVDNWWVALTHKVDAGIVLKMLSSKLYSSPQEV